MYILRINILYDTSENTVELHSDSNSDLLVLQRDLQ